MPTLSISPETEQAIETCRKNLGMVTHRLLTTFSYVPDEKLTYVPAETCNSSLALIVHCANSNEFFAQIITNRKMPNVNPQEAMSEEAKKLKEPITREAAVEKLKASVKIVEDALTTVDDEAIATMIETPMVTMPMNFWMYLPARHMDNHASQIDYLQTIWGDMDWHMA